MIDRTWRNSTVLLRYADGDSWQNEALKSKLISNSLQHRKQTKGITKGRKEERIFDCWLLRMMDLVTDSRI